MTFRANILTGWLTCLSFIFVACSPRVTPVEAGIRTHTLLVGNAAEPGDLDPHLASILTDQIIVNTLFEGLTVLDEQTNRPLPAAAESWGISSDGLVWTFHLRADLKWSNGEALIADDFVQSWRRALNPAFAADNAWYLFPIKNAETYNAGQLAHFSDVGISTPNDRTIAITLERPTPYLPALVSLPAWFPLNPRSLEKFGALAQRGKPWTRPGNLVSNGAYQLTEWTPDVRIVLGKNLHHRDSARAQLEHIVFLPIAKPDDEERNYRAGQLHVTFNLPLTKIAPWRERAPNQLRIDSLLQSNFLRFNTTRAPFTDVRVRRALSLALDRELLARTVLQGSRLPAATITPPHTGAYVAPAGVPTDLDTARHLLAEAGYARGVGLPTLELMCRNDEIMPRLAEAIQAIWQQELGVAITISQVEQKTWIQNQQNLDYSVCMSAWTADFPDPVTFLELFVGEGSYNWTGWNRPKYDQLLTAASTETDETVRFTLLQKAETLLLQDAPVAPLFFGAQTYLLHPGVKGWTPSPLGFRRFQLISLEP
uniref:peptide ABC transporter substrate-binding protein n=1 Tax=Cephaloticoccus sp. TaxID=1985742 RepID=UPI00404ACB47